MTVNEARKALLKLFQCYNLSGNDYERSLKFSAYWEVLEVASPDAIVDVCRRACRGEIGLPGFMPTSGELFQAARQYVIHASAGRTALPAPARIIPSDEQLRVSAGFRALSDALRGIDPSDPQIPMAARVSLLEIAATARDPRRVRVDGWPTAGDAAVGRVASECEAATA